MKRTSYLLGLFLLLLSSMVLAMPSCQDSLQQGEFTAAIQSAHSVLQTNTNPPVDTLLCLGRALRLNGDKAEALMVFQQAETLALDNSDKVIAAIFAGHLNKEAGGYARAGEHYQQAKHYAMLAGNVSMQRVADAFIGDVELEQGKLDSALAYYLDASKRDANDNERAQSAERIAKVYFQQQAFGKAVEYQLKAYLMQRQSGEFEDVLRAGILLGQYQLADKNYLSAENVLSKMSALAKSQNARMYEFQALMLLIKVKQKQDNNQDAVAPYLKAALALAQDMQRDDLLREVLNLVDVK